MRKIKYLLVLLCLFFFSPIAKAENLYDYMKDNAIPDDISSEFVYDNRGINFEKESGITNGKGIYYHTYDGDDNKYYYYRGDTNNYFILGNYCWKIIRTAENNGIKLLYYGVKNGNTCQDITNNYIQKSSFGVNNNSGSYVGYMYDAVYRVSSKSNSTISTSNLYGKSVKYENGQYRLVDTGTYNLTYSSGSYSNDNYSNIKDRHYTCFNTTGICSSVKYIIDVNPTTTSNNTTYEGSVSYIDLSNGEKIEDAIDNMYNKNTINVNDSKAKQIIDSWFESNMLPYLDYLEDVTYCNNRVISSLGGWNSNGGSISSAGLRFDGYLGLDLRCQRDIDSFSTSNPLAKLTYPVALITYQEAIYSGSEIMRSDINMSTMTPIELTRKGNPSMGALYSSGKLILIGTNSYGSSLGLRPVIAIKGDLDIVGTGSQEEPYMIKGTDGSEHLSDIVNNPIIIEEPVNNQKRDKASDFIKKIATDNGGNENEIGEIGITRLSYDGTSDNNLRYVNVDPNNYVIFNGELWRIIGVFGNQIKIIKAETIGKRAWSSNNSNDWSNSDLYLYLNNEYYNSLSTEAKKMISDTEWQLGAIEDKNQTVYYYYDKERQSPSNNLTNKIGIMYISDYAFAFSPSYYSTNATNIYSQYNSYTGGYLPIDNWLFIDSWEWFLSLYKNNSKYGCYYNNGGIIGCGNSLNSDWYNVRPVLYLNENVSIYSGDGTKKNPYLITDKYLINIEIKNETRDLDIAVTDMTQVEYEEEVRFKVTPVKGYKVNSIEIVDEENHEIEYNTTDDYYTFIMPASNVTIIPSYEKVSNAINIEDSINTKEIMIEVNNFKAVVYEEVVRFIIIPEDDYEIELIEIKDKDNNVISYIKTNNENEYEFIMPDTNVTLTPKYRRVGLVNIPDTLKNRNVGDISYILLFTMIMALSLGTLLYSRRKSKNN